MSTSIGKKIRQIRDFLGLSRSEMGDVLGVPGRSLEGLEQERRVPGGDFLLKLSEKWPEYALWLLTDQTIPQHGQVSPTANAEPVSEIWITEVVDGRFLEALEAKPEALQKLVFLQSEEEEHTLAALLFLPKEGNPSIQGVKAERAILIQSGNLNFSSTHGGRLALLSMREWLNKEAPLLIQSADFCTISQKNIELLACNWCIKRNLIFSNSSHPLHSNFKSWVQGSGIYQYAIFT